MTPKTDPAVAVGSGLNNRDNWPFRSCGRLGKPHNDLRIGGPLARMAQTCNESKVEG
jgi:hypothetical protein